MKIARLIALCLFVAASAAWAYQLHLAGCTADLKGESWGNPDLALEIEAQGFLFGLLASGMMGAALALSVEPIAPSSRTLRFIAGAGVCFVILLVAGFYIEEQSTASCSLKAPRAGSP